VAAVFEAIVAELAGALGEDVSAVWAGVVGVEAVVITVVLLGGGLVVVLVVLVVVVGRSHAATARAASVAAVRMLRDFMGNLLFQCIQ
jgi:hypothetical protein